MAGPLSQLLSGGPVRNLANKLGDSLAGWLGSRGWFGGGNVDGPIEGQGTLNQLQGQQNAATGADIWSGAGGGVTTSAPSIAPQAQPENADSIFVPQYVEAAGQVENSPMAGQGAQEHRTGLLNKLGERGNLTNMVANGQQMITGTGDPNGRYRKRRTPGN